MLRLKKSHKWESKDFMHQVHLFHSKRDVCARFLVRGEKIRYLFQAHVRARTACVCMYLNACARMRLYAHVCARMRTYVHVFARAFTRVNIGR